MCFFVAILLGEAALKSQLFGLNLHKKKCPISGADFLAVPSENFATIGGFQAIQNIEQL